MTTREATCSFSNCFAVSSFSSSSFFSFNFYQDSFSLPEFICVCLLVSQFNMRGVGNSVQAVYAFSNKMLHKLETQWKYYWSFYVLGVRTDFLPGQNIQWQHIRDVKILLISKLKKKLRYFEVFGLVLSLNFFENLSTICQLTQFAFWKLLAHFYTFLFQKFWLFLNNCDHFRNSEKNVEKVFILQTW